MDIDILETNKKFITLLKEAKIKYNAKTIEFHIYGDESEFPQNWYRRIGLKKDNELIIMNGDVEDVLKHLTGTKVDNAYTNEFKEVINYSYDDLINLYSSLSADDIAYIFDMIPEYAYVDTLNEKDYINSIIHAMKNGAKVNLYIIGDENQWNKLKNNNLYNILINSCYGNSRIIRIIKEQLKEKVMPNDNTHNRGVKNVINWHIGI